MDLNHPAIRTADLAVIACPEAWEGTLTDGSDFRLRYRSGWASLTISKAVDCYPYRVEHTEGEWVGDSRAGIFDDDSQRNDVFARLYERHTADA